MLNSCRFLATLLLTALTTVALAQSSPYPNKTIRMLVGFPPGGISDVLARAVSAKLSQTLGQQVVVDNRPGAGTTIAAEILAKAAPDGYTLDFVDATTQAINASLYAKLPYDTLKDFTYIGLVASTPLMLVINPSLSARSVQELIALAKTSQLNYASSGNGTTMHLAGETFKSMAGLDVVHVPYKGGAPAVVAVLSGDVAYTFSTMSATLPHVKSGKLRALGVTTSTRIGTAPEIPTVGESGLPAFEIVLYSGVIGPAGMPKEIVDRLNTELSRVVNLPDMKEMLTNSGAVPVTMSPEQFATHMRAEVVKLGKAVKESGAKAD